MRVELTLTDDQLDVLAGLVAERLSTHTEPGQAALVDAQTVADTLGISRDTVYEHAAELGGRRIGDGARPRWRFNVADALAAWQPSTDAPTRTAPRRRRSNDDRSHLLPVHGDQR
jgi:hypothetical protein